MHDSISPSPGTARVGEAAVTAATALVRSVPSGAGAPLRLQTKRDAVALVAAKLFEPLHPHAPQTHVGSPKQDILHYYAPGVLADQSGGPDLRFRLAETVRSGGRLFLKGSVLGAGATTLVTDFARAFNHTAKDRGLPDRVAYLALVASNGSPKMFLDAVSTALEAPLQGSELRFRSPEHLAKRILATLVYRQVRTLIIDHVGNASDIVRQTLGDLMQAIDPASFVPLEPDAVLHHRVGLVLVDHRPPAVLFRGAPETAKLLNGCVAELGFYRTRADVGEALRQAGVGLEDFDESDQEDAEFADALLEYTHGLPALMTPFLQLVDQIARTNRCRPSPVIAHSVLPWFRKTVELREGHDRDGRVRYDTTVVGGHAHVAAAPITGRDNAPRPGRPSRASKLKEKRESRDIAEAELRDMQRQRAFSVPGSHNG